MTDTTLHDDIDRLDTGISQHPDVSGIISAARRRRRRTRTIVTAGGLATAAVVAPLALLIGGGAPTAPSSPGFAGSVASATSEADAFTDIRAAVTAAFPGATPSDTNLFADLRAEVYAVDGLQRLYVSSSTAAGRYDCMDRCERVGDQNVLVVPSAGVRGKDGKEFGLSVQVTPVDPANGDTVTVGAWVQADSQAEADAVLPSVETLTALARDGRLAPQTFASEPVAYPAPTEEQRQYEARYAAEMTAAVTAAVPTAQLEAPIDWWGFGRDWGQGYQLNGDARLVINASVDGGMAGDGRRACGSEPDEREVVTRCTETVVGDQVVRVSEGDYSGKGRNLFRYVDVFPVDGADGPTVWVDSGVGGEGASMDQLPSVEALTAIALDPRVAPTQERAVRPSP